MKEIIEALEAAVGPDRSIDGMIAHAVNLHMPDDPEGWPLRYTESIDAAMTLVPEGMEKDFTDLYGVARVSVGINAEPGPFYGTHEGGSLAIALCIAALRARSQIESLPANDSEETRLEI